MKQYRKYISGIAILVAASLLMPLISSCSKNNSESNPIVISTTIGSSETEQTHAPGTTPTPTPIPYYTIATVDCPDNEFVYAFEDEDTASRIIGAAVNETDFLVLEEGTEWCKVLYGKAEGEEGYIKTEYLQLTISTKPASIHDSFFYMDAHSEMGTIPMKFNNKVKVVPSTYTVIEMLPEDDSPGAKLIETEVTKTQIDVYTTGNVLLAKDTTLYLKDAIIRATPIPSPTPDPAETTPTPTATQAPTATPTPTSDPEPTPTTSPTTGETSGSSESSTVELASYSRVIADVTTATPTPTPTPEPVEIIIKNGKITSCKGVVLDEDISFKIGTDKGHVVTTGGDVIAYEGLFFSDADVSVTYGSIDSPDGEIAFEINYYFLPAMLTDNLVDVTRFSETIQIDMLMAKEDSIAGGNVYGQQICLLQQDTLEKLLNAQSLFVQDGYSIIIYDAYRPYSVTCLMYDIHKDGTYVAGKRLGSVHNRGAAVDISLIDLSTGLPLEMPSPIHTLDSTSNRNNSSMTETAKANMDYMANIMLKCGFTLIASEWWHFSDSECNNYLRTDHDLTKQIQIIY